METGNCMLLPIKIALEKTQYLILLCSLLLGVDVFGAIKESTSPFPNETLLPVLDFLEGRDLAELARVNKRFCSLIKSIKIESSNYSINLMWINRSLNEKQLYIHPSKDEASLEYNF
ncbi:MAG: F-box protein [Candidatus Babeliales bacterium]